MKRVLVAGVALLLFAAPGAHAQQYDNHRDQATQGENRDHDREVRGIPHWERGDRVPEEYRGERYAFDWRAMHLKRPARGYHWIKVGDREMLVSDRTGVVREMRIEGEHR